MLRKATKRGFIVDDELSRLIDDSLLVVGSKRLIEGHMANMDFLTVIRGGIEDPLDLNGLRELDTRRNEAFKKVKR